MRIYCCKQIDIASTLNCNQHNSVNECPDVLIKYTDRFDEFGLIIHDGGNSIISISFCPFCGSKLPDSKRDLWFKELEQLGFDNPFEQNIPKEYTSSEWYKNENDYKG